jgi:hypothetical protein
VSSSSALGDIECDRSGCPVQLVFDFTDSHLSLQENREPCNESDRFSIDFQFFMIESTFMRWVHEPTLNLDRALDHLPGRNLPLNPALPSRFVVTIG